MSKIGDLVFFNGLDVSLISLFPLAYVTHDFKFFNGTFGYAWETMCILGEVIFAFDGGFVI